MKTIQELDAELEAIFSAGVNFKLYLSTSDTSQGYRLADFDDGATESVCPAYIAGVRQFFLNADLTTINLSAMDHRADTLMMYDMAEEPVEFARLKQLQTGPEPDFFVFAQNNLSDVRTLAIKISSTQKSVVFFKKFYPVSLVKRDQILLVVGASTRFKVIDTDILKISPGFDVMLLDNEFYINGFAKFEKAFSFDEIANRSMQAVATTILTMNIVNDTKGHLANLQASKKDILRAGGSPVLAFDSQTILDFVQSKEAQIGIKIVAGKLELSSRDSVKRLFKLLNDDYLTSGLTAFEYETLAKNKLP